MLIMMELRIEPIEGSREVSMMEGQDKLSKVCRIQQTVNGPPKLITMSCLTIMSIPLTSKSLFLHSELRLVG
jgi:hypothetical protein